MDCGRRSFLRFLGLASFFATSLGLGRNTLKVRHGWILRQEDR